MSHTFSPSAPLWPDASLDELLSLARERYELEFETVTAAGVSVEVLQVANMREILDRTIAGGALSDAIHTLPLWAKIWPASVIMGHMLRHVSPHGHTVLEIGAGCGVAGLVAAALGFERVCISDIDEDALLFARINILKNGLECRAEVRRVDILQDGTASDWSNRYSFILGSEILYLEHLYRPLVKFLKRRLVPPGSIPEPEVWLASDHRRNPKPFFKRAEKEFAVNHARIGARQEEPAVPSPTDGDTTEERQERHLLMLHRLRPLAR